MKLTFVLRLSLLLALLPVTQAQAAGRTAYEWGVSARLKEMQDDIDGAIADYDQALALDPKDAISYNARGSLKKQKNDFTGAIADYDKAIALKPEKDLALLYGNRGSAKQESGDLDGAMVDYDQVIALKPDYAIIYNNRGAIKGSKHDFDGAIADYSKAIALEPKEAQFHENRADTKLLKGDFEGAIADYDQAVSLEPDRVGHYYYRGNAKLRFGDLDGAIADFGKLCELKPGEMLGYYVRAIARQAKADFEGALLDYDKAIALDKEGAVDLRTYREITLRRLQRGTPFAELAKAVAQWKEGWPKNIGLYLVDALSEPSLLNRAGQGDAKAVPVQQCSANYFIGMTRLLAGDKSAAQKYFEQSLATKQTGADEFILARSELARLAGSPRPDSPLLNS